MRVHYIQHISFEGLGYIETWLRENNHDISSTKTWENDDFPKLEDFDVLIILGGPMGVYDEHLYKWLKKEKGFIFDAIEAGKKIIGICLGAQLIASVLGATVCTNRHKEIGWFPIDINASFSDWLQAEVSSNMRVFHWHGDKFDVPYGATNHAVSEACNHQLFTYEQNIIGIQFHLEATVNTVQQMIENGNNELVNDKYIQDKTEILNTSEYYKKNNMLMAAILSKLITSRLSDMK